MSKDERDLDALSLSECADLIAELSRAVEKRGAPLLAELAKRFPSETNTSEGEPAAVQTLMTPQGPHNELEYRAQAFQGIFVHVIKKGNHPDSNFGRAGLH